MATHRPVRITGGLVSMVAAATTYALHTLSPNTKRAVLKKLRVFNHTGGNVEIQIGYDTLGAVWTPVMPDLLAPTGIDTVWTEAELPICGNTPEGFQADTTAGTGTLGNIAARVSAAGAAPADVEIQAEVEEI